MKLSYSLQFIEKEITRYLEKGFGTYNKNDFEVLIFKGLLDQEFKGKNNYQISRCLQIPESKVKRLRYESDLKYSDSSVYDEEKYRELDHLLKQAIWKTSNSKIQISVEDLALRKFLDNILKTHNSFSDSSFNSEIVTISPSDLEIIFSSYEEGKKVIDDINNLLKNITLINKSTKPPTFKELLPEIILELLKTSSGIAKSVEGIVNLSPSYLIEKIGLKFITNLPYFKNK